jgi:DNA-binding response OmpR family regulator
MHLVLIVEDDPALQSVLRTFFEANGYRVVAATVALGGIRDARPYNPDIVIVDLGLPDRDDSGSLRVYIGSLHCKLEPDPSRPQHIITELGLGYRLLLNQEVELDG